MTSAPVSSLNSTGLLLRLTVLLQQVLDLLDSLPRKAASSFSASKDVLAKSDEYFDVRKNIIHERAKFNTRDQREDETADEYITELYELIETCGYGTLKDQILLDHTVVGIHDMTKRCQRSFSYKLTLPWESEDVDTPKRCSKAASHISKGAPDGRRDSTNC